MALVSSAKDLTDECKTETSMSYIMIMKRIGPRTDPCGTPDFTSAGSDFVPFTSTVWVLPCRNEYIHRPNLPPIPRHKFAEENMKVNFIKRLGEVKVDSINTFVILKVF